LITGGAVNNLALLSAETGTINNLSSPGVAITGGSATGLLHLSLINLTGSNFSSSNVLIAGGSISGLSTLTAGTGTINNFNSLGAIITGGSIDGTPVGASTPSTGVFSSLNAPAATLTTLAVQTLTGPVDANIGTLSILVNSGSGSLAGITANLGAYQIATNANLGTLATTVNTINANLGSFQTRTSANIGALTNATIPVGGIILWSGAASAVPAYWALCDGNNGTPDLRGRFVMGASATSGNVGTRGGSADAVVVSHTHTANVTDPGHAHAYLGGQLINNGYYPGNNIYANGSLLTSAANTGISVTNASTGVSGTGANLPPYYALCYIMRTA
jgi:hypothetical protein